QEPARARRSKATKAEADQDQPLLEEDIVFSFRKPGGRDVLEIGQAPTKEDKPKGRRRKADDRELELQIDPSQDLPVPVWRSRSGPPPQDAFVEADGDQERAGSRRNRRGRRRRGAEEPITAADALIPAAAEEPARRSGPGRKAPVEERPAQPLVPAKPLIPIPADAPQIVLRNGVPTLVRDGRVYPPILFFGSSSDERRAQTVLEEARLAGEAGIAIISHLVEFEIDAQAMDAAVKLAAYMLTKTLDMNPEAQVLFRLVFVAPKGWQDRYREARYLSQDGTLAEPSVCDDSFWRDAADCLEVFIRKLRLLPNSEHILGLHLERGEWFFGEGWGYDTSPAARSKFRDWARTRYAEDVVALRAAWFDGDASFENLEVPPYQEHGSEKFVRSSRKERKWVDYHLFLSDATVARIGELAYTAKSASEGYFLIGASYGYTFEWSHPSSGHLSLGKLLRTPEIDFIAGPPSYKSREPGGAAPFPAPIDSFSLNGKLYISEEDFKTAIGQSHEPDDFNPVIKTPQALESVHWRGAGAALAHASGMCWMDLWGNGWLRTHTIWERGARVREALTHRMAAPLSEPDVAIFIDERALAYLVDQKAFTLLVQNVRESVLRSGLSAGFYLLSDLQHREKFPESKLYVFLNAWDIRPELRSAIKQRLQRDNKVLFWLYAAGLFDSGRESLERAREVTGIALKPQPFHSKAGTTILNRRHPLCEALGEKGLVSEVKLEPSYFAIPEEALVLGEYTQTGLPSFVVKEFKGEHPWTSVFLGEPLVTPSLIRALGQMAGAHVWNFHEDVVHVCAPFMTVHCTGTGQRTITLPSKWSAYNLISREWIQPEGSGLRFHANDGSTHVMLVGVREELEAILQVDPSELLRMEELPPKPDNTVRFDADMFDVPVMKLGEWMEGSADDELADDILLRPHLVLEEPEQELDQDRPGRRRRRRRRGGGGNGPSMQGEPAEESARPRRDGTEEAYVEELGMSVLFRKRD
ncbi:MAG TPA: hypothetical protein VM328_02740, partial [Fimbriimonadaceae bacterium]|nr:hypothetical protein [Fimbriimonadaceae bacterium]